ncbi:MAG TPA: DUF6748 domain-containing protein [Gaiellaceae bacterium]|nr:DUF6748 domain-containing protein [Gaiellaceae bacterium]
MRTLLAAALAALAGAGLPGGSPPAGPGQYVVRLDPRLCPAPLCGGYWVALANRARTACHDGLRRPRCYAARAVDGERHPLEAPLPEGALARAELEAWSFEGFGRLGVLVVHGLRRPAGRTPGGTFYRVRDLGARCGRAPCFPLRAVHLNGRSRSALSAIDLDPAGLEPQEREAAEAELRSRAGLVAAGTVAETRRGGRVLRVARVYLRAPQPRA